MIAMARRERLSKAIQEPVSTARTRIWSSLGLPLATLWWRELVRFYRQRSRVAAAIGTPLVFWLLIGSGFGDSFRATGPIASAPVTSLEYFFPGTILLVVMFTSIFSTMSVIEDRREGFLLSVLVAPISRAALVGGMILGGATLSLLQGLPFICLAPLVGIPMGVREAVEATLVLGVISCAMTALGFYFAWRLDSVQGFHGIMNLVMLPMWLLSGALFPSSGSHPWVGWIMRLNPLGYGLSALRQALYGEPAAGGPTLAVSVAVIAGFGLLAALAGLQQVRRTA